MLIDPALLSPAVRIAGAVLALPAYALACARAPWRALLASRERQHVWLGSVVLLLLVWSMRAGITPGLALGFLLVPALTLMQGIALAVTGAGLVLGAQCLLTGGWSAWPASLLCTVLVPAGLITALHRAVGRHLPRHFFVFFFVTVYAGSVLAFNAAGAARLALLAASGTLPWARLPGEYVAYLPMMSLAEGFLNGILIAVAVVYRPAWVTAFEDRLYLRR